MPDPAAAIFIHEHRHEERHEVWPPVMTSYIHANSRTQTFAGRPGQLERGTR